MITDVDNLANIESNKIEVGRMSSFSGRLHQCHSGLHPLKPHRANVEQIREMIRTMQKQISNEEITFPLSKPIRSDIRDSLINGIQVKRLVVFLRGSGCAWMKTGAGCTMCGFYRATRNGIMIPDQDYICQIQSVLENSIEETYPIICLYNDGNMLNTEEINSETLLEILRLIVKKEGVKKIIIESRPEYINEKILLDIKNIVKNIAFEVAIGLETTNDTIRSICINKGFTYNEYLNAHRLLLKFGFNSKPLLLLKPPFLTEGEAIADVLQSIHTLKIDGITNADLEIIQIQEDTFVHMLWKYSLYQPPAIHAITEILKNVPNDFYLYISPFEYSVPAIVKSKGCSNCDEMYHKLFIEYNKNRPDININFDLQCKCINLYKNNLSISLVNDDVLRKRISHYLDIIKTIS